MKLFDEIVHDLTPSILQDVEAAVATPQGGETAKHNHRNALIALAQQLLLEALKIGGEQLPNG